MAPLFSAGGYDVHERSDGAMILVRDLRILCQISGACAGQLRQLFLDLRSPDFAADFGKEVNCHGLAEYALGRRLKWRSKAKMVGTDGVAPGAPLPSPLPAAYQLVNAGNEAMHSAVVLGGSETGGPVYILDKCNTGPLRIETYRESVRGWMFPVVSVRMRQPFPHLQTARKAA